LIRSILRTASLILMVLILGSWGATGHRKISESASLSFNQQMQDFYAWKEFLTDHASDADYRKDEDPDEAPRHYIDIDSYYSFVSLGRIPQTLDSVIMMYGSSFVYDNGILPWATMSTVEAIQQSFASHDFETAKVLAADLGHYVGDGHMPMHITQNYNGQNTGNTGIHSRYESSMINEYIDQIQYSGDSIRVIPDINAYIFDYLYTNYKYVDSILMADNYARSVAGNTNSPAYRQALWQKTGAFSTLLMKRASHALTELIYTAWVNAGSPSLSASAVPEPAGRVNAAIVDIHDSPFDNTAAIRYVVTEATNVILTVSDLTGKQHAILVNSFSMPGNFEAEWNKSSVPGGIYLITLTTSRSRQVKKLVVLK